MDNPFDDDLPGDDGVAIRMGEGHILVIELPDGQNPNYRASVWEPDLAREENLVQVASQTFFDPQNATQWCFEEDARRIATLHDEIAVFLHYNADA